MSPSRTWGPSFVGRRPVRKPPLFSGRPYIANSIPAFAGMTPAHPPANGTPASAKRSRFIAERLYQERRRGKSARHEACIERASQGRPDSAAIPSWIGSRFAARKRGLAALPAKGAGSPVVSGAKRRALVWRRYSISRHDGNSPAESLLPPCGQGVRVGGTH